MKTFQDFEKNRSISFLKEAINDHKGSAPYRIAKDADRYDRQENVTISQYVQKIFSLTGVPVVNYVATNAKIPSNFFHRLNTQRKQYSLGNGISFSDTDGDGIDQTKEALGPHFDHDISEAAYFALIHGVSFVFWNLDRIHVFKLTEFVPLYDESDGTLRAGIRFWRLAKDRPMIVVLYEEDGYTEYREKKAGGNLVVSQEKRAYKQKVAITQADGETVVGEENYSSLPIVPMWGSSLKQSTLVGMRSSIDNYDLIKSGFANDLRDCSQIYWIVKNASAMDEEDLLKLRDRMLFAKLVTVDDDQDVEPYTQEPPYQARKELLEELRAGIYEDFGGLDVHTIAAGATNDHIDAAYQPMDEEASDFEYCISECVRQILALQGIEDSPVFKRQRVSNQYEQVQMVTMEAQWLDQATVLRKLPNITPEEVKRILDGVDSEDQGRLMSRGA